MVNRKKKAEKKADFQKQKLKVGKKKALAENHTDTSFKSRAITLITQSVTVNKSNLATNNRNLTLGDLVSQVKHHNAGVRKEALFGLVDLLDRHPRLLLDQTTVIVESISKGIVDEDSSVRKACIKLCKEKLCTLSQAVLSPFLDLLVTVTCSAMTHIYEDVKEDSVIFLALWLKLESNLAERHRSKLLPNFFSLLKIGASAKSSHQKDADNFTQAKKGQLWSQKSRVSILEHLFMFLGHLVKDHLPKGWYFQNFLKENTLDQVFNNHTPTSNLIFHTPENLFNAGTFLVTMDALGSQALTQQDEFSSTTIFDLYPYLMSTWVETSGLVFEDSSQLNVVNPDIAALHLVMRLVLWTWRFEAKNTQVEILNGRFQQFQKHMLPNFPFGQNQRIANNAKLMGLLHDMNSAVAEISALYQLRSNLTGGAAIILKSTSKKVVDYLLVALSDSSTPRERLVALFPSVWWFLNGSDFKSCCQLFQALLDFTVPILPCSAQLAALDFIHRILIVESHPHYTGNFSLRKQNGFASWVRNICHSLSTLHSKYEPHSVVIEIIVNILHHVIRFDSHNILNSCQIQLEIALLMKGGFFSSFTESQQFHLICALYHAVGLAPELLEAMSLLLASPIDLSSRLRERIDSLISFV